MGGCCGPDLNGKGVDAALAAHCIDIAQACIKLGQEPGCSRYSTRWTPTALPPCRPRPRPGLPAGASSWPAARPRPFLPLRPGGAGHALHTSLLQDRAAFTVRVLTAQPRIMLHAAGEDTAAVQSALRAWGRPRCRR